MSGDKGSKGRVIARNNKELETRKDSDTSGACTDENGDRAEDSPTTLDSLRQVVSEVVAEGLRDLTSEMKKELSQIRLGFREDMKKQPDKLLT